MATYEFPGIGTLSVLRDGEDHPGWGFGLRYKYNVRATDTEGNEFRSWITVPDGWSEDHIVSGALDAIAYEVVEFTGDDTGNMWDVYAYDMYEGSEFAASYRVNGVSHYRVQPFSYDRNSDTYATLSEIESAWKNGLLFYGYPDSGDTLDVYFNNDDEPSVRFTFGPRGGIKRERF